MRLNSVPVETRRQARLRNLHALQMPGVKHAADGPGRHGIRDAPAGPLRVRLGGNTRSRSTR